MYMYIYKTGCSRPLLNKNNINLKEELYNNTELLDSIINLKAWINDSINNHKCIWGRHAPVSTVQANLFSNFFKNIENVGYNSYNNTNNIIFILREYLIFNYELAYNMQLHPFNYHEDAVKLQSERLGNLKSVYELYSGINFIFEILCTRNSETCNTRRKIDGKNHVHAIEIELPKRYICI
jgi:hypothetical protein